jgi:guanine deaminase
MSGFAVCGTIMHTPVQGACEVIEDALITVGADGGIEAVLAPADSRYARALDDARTGGGLFELSAQQYLLPGLVDLHIHAPQWPQLGKALHLPLYDWLQNCTFPLEARYADTAFADRIYGSLVASLLANGTTTAVYFATVHLEATMRLADHCLTKGQRGYVGKVVMDDAEQCPDYYRDASAGRALDETVALIEYVRGLDGNRSGLVKPVVTPRFIPSCSDEALEGLGAIAGAHECHVQTHCSESDWEHAFVRERHSMSDTRSLARFGLVNRHTVLAHANFVSADDMDVIGSAGAGIAHCPLSNFYFSNAVFPLRAALDKGLHVGLGTDISGGPSASMLHACRHAVAASRALEDGVDAALDPGLRGRAGSRVDFMEAFWLATAGGAEALDVNVGMFAPGYQFDAMLIDAGVDDTSLRVWQDLDSLEDVFQKIVYTAERSNIRKVWVDGRPVVDKNAKR